MTEETIDVLCLTSSMGIGGAEKQISVSCERLAEKGVDVQIVCLRPLGAMGEQLVDSQVDVVSLNVEKNHQLLYKFPRLIAHLLANRPDIVHGHMYHSNVLSRLLSLLSPTAESVSTVHSTYETSDSGLPKTSDGDLPEVTIRELTYRATDVLSDLTTFVSESSRQRYIDINAVSERKSMVVYNGIDIEEFHRDPKRRAAIRDRHGADEEFVWLAAGRFTNAKDYPTMIRAFTRLSEPNSELWILGEGELKPEIEREIRREGVTDRISLLGTTDDVPSYMSAADGFVLSSHWEGFGLVVAEAMACELPVVATRCGGPEEIVVDGETGHLCEARDPAALAEAMDQLRATDPAERSRMGQRSRRVIEDRFDLEEITDQWKEIYRSLLN